MRIARADFPRREPPRRRRSTNCIVTAQRAARVFTRSAARWGQTRPTLSPPGTLENSPAHQCWVRSREKRVPAGTKESFVGSHHCRPCRDFCAVMNAHPPLKRWAVFGCPCGTETAGSVPRHPPLSHPIKPRFRCATGKFARFGNSVAMSPGSAPNHRPASRRLAPRTLWGLTRRACSHHPAHRARASGIGRRIYRPSPRHRRRIDARPNRDQNPSHWAGFGMNPRHR